MDPTEAQLKLTFNVGNMFSPVADAKVINKQGRKDMFYLTTHSTHFIYGYMASNIW